jgi:hypothetical protein
VLQDKSVPALGLWVVEVERPSPTSLGISEDVCVVPFAAL